MSRIYCFSSTGNSLYVANRIAKQINASVISMTKKNVSCNDDVIGIVCPVYFWGLPITVDNFIDTLNITNSSAYIFLILTFGSIFIGADGIVNNKLKSKGLKLSYYQKIRCVENYLPAFKVNDTSFNWQSIDDKIDTIIKDIQLKNKNNIGYSTFMNSIARSMFPAKNPNCDKNFIISNECIHCGLCSKVCPRDNIIVTKDTVSFKGDCEHCLGCIHICPKNAIDYKKFTQGKRRYKNSHIKVDDLLNLNSATGI
ncbi:MAG: EFR1 family ferrodoxin [Ruminococcus sp.]|nr:EFR1 family ferrodoxin [Ruminococcus sp.]